MTDREFRSLSKTQLIDILLKQESLIKQLEDHKSSLENNLNDRKIKINKAGSLADASAAISGLFDSAQETADLYLDTVLTVEVQKLRKLKKLEEEARRKTDALYKDADYLLGRAFFPFIELVTESHELFNTYSQKLDLARRDYDKLLEDTGILDVKSEFDKKPADIFQKLEEIDREFGIEEHDNNEELNIPENLGIRIRTEDIPAAVSQNRENAGGLTEEDSQNNNKDESNRIIEEILAQSEKEISENQENTGDSETGASIDLLTEEAGQRKNIPGIVKNIASIAGILALFAAASVLISTYLLPVFNIRQGSMSPTLENGEVVVFLAVGEVEKGDIVAFHHSNSLLIKRIIGASGDLIDITDDGEVLINGVVADEPYVSNQALGECDIELPFRVPEGRFFVMGDNRAESLDSRYQEIGAISEEQIAGKALLRVLPFGKLKLF